MKKLERREVDIALLPGPVRIPHIIGVSLGGCDLKWLGAPGFRPTNRTLSAEEIAKLPIVGMPQDADAHRAMTRWFEQAGITPKRVHYCNNFSVLALLVRRGVGVSLLQSDLFAKELDDETLAVVIDGPAATRVEYSAVFRPDVHHAILPEVAALAQEESWFLGHPRSVANGFTSVSFIGTPVRQATD